ncbi:HAMP domain-containing histidine kinase [Bacillus pseudomycoides]|uniref:HAMP domain-containing histidine kinase n=1 Tax=Bacillus pseudomycoides TaxID=64104 RepID=UPI000BEF551C|nr:HAMP domain-containing histidine kinase [Bacillus pseudomycoides]PEK71433.1 ATPase [Bacillus pseudomycoides]PFY56160.1 ATPase [Bacillus pseudomycoides]
MKLKGYLIDRFPLIVSYIVSLCLFGLVLQLQGLLEKRSIQWSTWLYGLLLATIVFIIYLIYDYRKRSVFLNRIEQYIAGGHTLHDSLLIDASYMAEQEMIVEAFILLRQQYMNEVHQQHAKDQQQMIFMNQWIHQMKTPVSVIELLLQKFGKAHREARETVESIREENNRILHGLDLALHMARLEQFAKDYKVEVVNVLEVVREVINQNRKSFIQSSVYPKVMFEEETCTIASDRKWISIAINQIVMNAIKYTKISQVDKKEIQFQIEEKEQTVLLHICDTGIGIPKQDIKRVFEPFFTGTNGRKTREATGMGLYITKEICDNLHHGIYVQSTEGESTTFTFQFAKDKEYHALMRKMTKL